MTLYSTRHLTRRRWAAVIIAAIVGLLAVASSAVSWTVDSVRPQHEAVYQLDGDAEPQAAALAP